MEINLIERCNKETEELLATETAEFLQKKISYFKENQEEFIYIDSPIFEQYRMEAIVFEFDEMFKVYTALFGFKLQKKYGEAIKMYFKEHLTSMLGSSSASFSGEDGLWEVNIALDAIEGFTGEETIEQANDLVTQFIEKMLAEIA